MYSIPAKADYVAMATVHAGRVVAARCFLAMEEEHMLLHDEALYPSEKIRARIFAVFLKAAVDTAEPEWVAKIPGATNLSDLVNLEHDLTDPEKCRLPASGLKDSGTYGALFFRLGIGRVCNTAGMAAVRYAIIIRSATLRLLITSALTSVF